MDKREKMALLMGEFVRSGQTQEEFSASRGLALPTFNYWLRKLKDESRGLSGFVRVKTGAASSGAGEQLELVYPNGVRLKTCSTDLSLLSRLDPSLLMFCLGSSHRYYLYQKPVGMGMGFDGL